MMKAAMTAELAAAMKSVLHVLIVEDDARYRGMLLAMLRDLSCEPVGVSSAVDALQWLATHKIDAILLDLNMPRMDGLTFLNQWRQRDQTTPVIILTGVGTLPAAQTAIRQGVSDFLTKPCHLGAMDAALDRVRRKLGQQRDAAINRSYQQGVDLDRTRSPHTIAGALSPSTQPATLAELERDAIMQALRKHGGNRSAAAAALGISRRTMHYRLAEYRQIGWLSGAAGEGIDGGEPMPDEPAGQDEAAER